MRKYYLIAFAFFCLYSYGQGLGKERIELLNETIVKLTIENSSSSGTGFVVSESGWIGTCNHVIQPAFYRNKKTREIDSIKTIYAKYTSGNKIPYRVVPVFYGNEYLNGLYGDYILLQPITDTIVNAKYLKIGKWTDVNDGDEIYTAGYPFLVKERIISRGTFAVKFPQEQSYTKANGLLYIKTRESGWTDMTLNKGNSGGPIILVGKKAKHDKVIGLASFIHNPDAGKSIELSKKLSEYNRINEKGGLTTNLVLAYALEVLSKNSFGISGVVSIDGLYKTLEQLNQVP